MRKIISSLGAALLLTGCASSPDYIESAYVSKLKYADLSCEMITLEAEGVAGRASELYVKLEGRWGHDMFMATTGVVFFPMLFLIEENDEPKVIEFANVKGEYERLYAAAEKKSCEPELKPLEQILEETA